MERDLREEKIMVRLTTAESEMVNEAAARVGLPVASWCRVAALAASKTALGPGGDEFISPEEPAPAWAVEA